MTQRDNPVALITGASRGLGLEISRLLAGNGFDLILTARNAPVLDAAADELRGHTEVLAVAGDVTDAPHVEGLVRRGLTHFGRIDALINNASELGPSPMPRLEEYPLEPLLRVFNVNVVAPLHLAQLVLPAMKSQGRGVIVNVTSDAGVEAYPTWGGYGASKAALEHLSRVLAAELEGSGIRLYVVDPGDMNTQMHRDAEPGVDLSDLPTPDVVAPAFLHLLTEESAPFARVQAQELLQSSAQVVTHAPA